jgi:hypothetical protein
MSEMSKKTSTLCASFYRCYSSIFLSYSVSFFFIFLFFSSLFFIFLSNNVSFRRKKRLSRHPWWYCKFAIWNRRFNRMDRLISQSLFLLDSHSRSWKMTLSLSFSPFHHPLKIKNGDEYRWATGTQSCNWERIELIGKSRLSTSWAGHFFCFSPSFFPAKIGYYLDYTLTVNQNQETKSEVKKKRNTESNRTQKRIVSPAKKKLKNLTPDFQNQVTFANWKW